MLILGWVGVSGTSYTAKQMPYMASNGLGGLFLLGTGAMLWLSADLRDEWRKLDRIEAAIREHGAAGLNTPRAAVTELDRRNAEPGQPAPANANRDRRSQAAAGASGRMS
jgi:hypothetical protein